MGKHLDDVQLGEIRGMRRAGLKFREIAEATGVSIPTIQAICDRGDDVVGSHGQENRGGSNKKVTKKIERAVVRKLEKFPFKSYQDVATEISEDFDIDVAARTINQIGLDNGFSQHKEVHKGYLTDLQRQERMDHSGEYMLEPPSFWTGHGGSDPIHFTLDGVCLGKAKDPKRALNAMKGFVRRRKGEGLDPDKIVGASKPRAETHKHLGMYMIGGGNGRITLCERYKTNGGKMSAAVMRPIIPKLHKAIRKASLLLCFSLHVRSGCSVSQEMPGESLRLRFFVLFMRFESAVRLFLLCSSFWQGMAGPQAAADARVARPAGQRHWADGPGA